MSKNMFQFILINILLFTFSAQALNYSFVLKVISEPGATQISESKLEIIDSVEQMPSCEIFKMRVNKFKHDEKKLDWLISRLNQSLNKSSDEMELQIQEIKKMRERQMEVRDELSKLKKNLIFTVDWQTPPGKWITDKKFALKIISPSMIWEGVDSFEPRNVQLDININRLKYSQEILMGDYCSKPMKFEVTIEKIGLN